MPKRKQIFYQIKTVYCSFVAGGRWHKRAGKICPVGKFLLCCLYPLALRFGMDFPINATAKQLDMDPDEIKRLSHDELFETVKNEMLDKFESGEYQMESKEA